MNAKAIRRIADNSLVCFGPHDGNYEPTWSTGTMTMTTNEDYQAVLVEWQGIIDAVTSSQQAKAAQLAIDLTAAKAAVQALSSGSTDLVTLMQALRTMGPALAKVLR